MNPNELILGQNSYPVIVKEIFDKIQKAKADTLTGSSLLTEIYKNLNESITPMLTLKPFITKAEKIAADDATLMEIVNFIKDKTSSGDLNFIINLCKEEHFENCKRFNHPSPESTVKEIETEFNKPASVIEDGIKNGLFNTLKSDLLGKIKKDLKVPEFKILNESAPVYAGNNQSIIKYNPIGLRYDDLKNDKILMLCESFVFELDKTTKKLTNLNESEINIPDAYKLLISAINSLSYNPNDNTFSLGLEWDFNITLTGDGKVMVNNKIIPASKVKDFLIESINVYTQNPTKVKNFVKPNYEKDADNFIMVVNNQKSLIKFDNLESIKNLNENSAILLDKNSDKPEILASSKGDICKMFESYSDMVNHANGVVNFDLTDNFKQQLSTENTILTERHNSIVKLNEEQKELNNSITKNNNLINLAEKNSPAHSELMENDAKLKGLLKQNIEKLDSFVNEFKLY